MNVVRHVRSRASLVVLAAVAAMLFGASSLGKLARGIYPPVAFPRLVAVAHVGDLPPQVVVTEVTRPIEEAFATIPGVRRVSSRTIRGATALSILFANGTDMWRALQIAEAHAAAMRGELPAGAKLHVERVTPAALPIVTFNVSGAPDPRTLRELASYVIRPALTGVPGVGHVEVQGGDVREIEVILKPEALAAAHITPSHVAKVLGNEEIIRAVGRAYDAHQTLTVMVNSQKAAVQKIAALPVASSADGPVPLSSVANVVEGAEDRTVDINGPSGDDVAISVSRAPGASAPKVVGGARAVIHSLIKSGTIPAGIKIQTVYDRSALIHDAMQGVRDAILLGVALSLVVLALFLRDPRAGITAAAAVPITLVITFGAMRLFGQTLNLMSLGGMAVAIGLVVDDAIVIVEAIVHRLEEGRGVAESAEVGTTDLTAAVIGTTLTTVVVFAPLGLLSGVVGSFFGALAVTLCSAVMLSLLVSLTVVPMLASWLLKARGAPGASGHRPGGALSYAYGRLVRKLVKHWLLGLVGVIAVAAAGVALSSHLATGFLPEMDEGAFVLDFYLPAGTSLGETNRVARGIDRILSTTPGIVTFTRRTGAEMGPATATQQNRGDILVRVAPRDRRKDIWTIMDEVRARCAREVPEADVEFSQVLQDALGDLSGNPRPIEVRIFGPDPHALVIKARQVVKRLEKIPSLVDITAGVGGDVPVLRAAVRPNAAAKLGVSPAGVAADLKVAIAGEVAAKVRRGDREIGIRVRMPDDVRFSPDAIASLPIAYGGRILPLSALARISEPAGPTGLTRENMRPVVIVSAAVRGGDLGGAAQATKRALAHFPLGSGYQIVVGGQAKSAKKTRRDLAGVFGIGVALVLGILIVQLRSLRMGLVVVLGAPLALVGAIATLVATGIPLNASSLMGCVLLAGLVVKNGILLLEYAQHEADLGVPFPRAVARAGQRRLRPILMTTLATIVGLVPLAFGFGAGSELQRPLAVATIGGLVLSTLVTLLAVPALAVALGPRGRRDDDLSEPAREGERDDE